MAAYILVALIFVFILVIGCIMILFPIFLDEYDLKHYSTNRFAKKMIRRLHWEKFVYTAPSTSYSLVVAKGNKSYFPKYEGLYPVLAYEKRKFKIYLAYFDNRRWYKIDSQCSVKGRTDITSSVIQWADTDTENLMGLIALASNGIDVPVRSFRRKAIG